MTKRKVYYCRQDTSFRQLKKFLIDNNVEYVFRPISKKNPLSEEEFKGILINTDNGVDDILAKRSISYKVLSEKVDFNNLTLNELFELINQFPELLRSPITVWNHSLYIGYNREDVGTLLNRKDKKHRLFQVMMNYKAS